MSGVVLPGDRLTTQITSLGEKHKVKLGAGIVHIEEDAVACRAGPIEHFKQKKWWVDTPMRYYTPAVGDHVIGVVTGRAGEAWKLDINASHTATLDFLAFENVSRKTRPNYIVGTTVYARVASADPDLEPELDCISPATGKADGFGELAEGIHFACPLHLCKQLMKADCMVLQGLSQRIAFELVVGVNGRIWVKAKSVKETWLVYRTLQAFMDGSIKDAAHVKTLLQTWSTSS